MEIEVLGVGCERCDALYEAAREAIARAGVDATLTKVESLEQIVARGVMLTPALVIDGQVRSTGAVLDADAIGALLREES